MKKKITIPTPCTQNWEEMKSTNSFDARFCKSCQKNVVDFTTKSDSEIARTLKKGKNLCGRFRTNQLDQEYTIPTDRKSWAVPGAVATLLALQTACTSIEKTTLNKTEPPKTEKVETTEEEIPVFLAEFPINYSIPIVLEDSEFHPPTNFIMGDFIVEDTENLPISLLIKPEMGSIPFWPRKRALEVSSPDYVPELMEKPKRTIFPYWLTVGVNRIWATVSQFFS